MDGSQGLRLHGCMCVLRLQRAGARDFLTDARISSVLFALLHEWQVTLIKTVRRSEQKICGSLIVRIMTVGLKPLVLSVCRCNEAFWSYLLHFS